MNRRNRIAAIPGAVMTLTLVLTLIPSPARAADAALPPAEEILTKAVEASGGRQAFLALRTRITYGVMEIKGMGIKLSMVGYAARPNLTYSEASSPAVGNVLEGTFADVAWESTAMTGPRIKEGAEKASALREALFDGLVDWKAMYKTAECTGVDSVEGKPCYRLVMVPAAGSPDTCYFSRETGLLALIRSVEESPMGMIPIEGYVGDYRKVDGVLLPFRSRQVVLHGMQEMILTVDSLKQNVDIPEDRFAPPAEVKELLEKMKSDSIRTPVSGEKK